MTGKAASGEVVTVSASFEVTGATAQADSDGATTSISSGSDDGALGADVGSGRGTGTGTGGSLAYTGTAVRPLLALAIVSAAIGSALVLISRRRRTFW